MNWSHWTRQFHRWLSVTFILTVIACFIALGQRERIEWLFYLPLLPLALLTLTGLYLFVLPYAVRWRNARRARAGG